MYMFPQNSAAADRAPSTVEFLGKEVPDFIPPQLWLLCSPDLNSVDYRIWGCMQDPCDLMKWSSDWLRSLLSSNRPSLTGPLTSGENDSRPVSRLRDSIWNSCYNLYFRLSFIVCTDSKLSMTATEIDKKTFQDVMTGMHFNFTVVVCRQLNCSTCSVI